MSWSVSAPSDEAGMGVAVGEGGGMAVTGKSGGRMACAVAPSASATSGSSDIAVGSGGAVTIPIDSDVVVDSGGSSGHSVGVIVFVPGLKALGSRNVLMPTHSVVKTVKTIVRPRPLLYMLCSLT